MCVEVIVCNVSVVFLRHSVDFTLYSVVNETGNGIQKRCKFRFQFRLLYCRTILFVSIYSVIYVKCGIQF